MVCVGFEILEHVWGMEVIFGQGYGIIHGR